MEAGNRWVKDLPYAILASLISLFLCTHSPNLEYDIDPSYITQGPSRPPLYPMFIWLFKWGGAYQYHLIMWVQGVLLFSSLVYARFWMKEYLKISDFLIFIICFIVVLTISLHFQTWFIQSEGLAFPLFIYTFFALIECFQAFKVSKLLYLAFLVSLLILTRLQFYYIYFIYALLCIWYLWQRISSKKIVVASSILFGSMILTILLNCTYHYEKHGFFGSGSYSGLMVLVQALYLAEDTAPDYFEDAVTKSSIRHMINQRNMQHLNEEIHLLTALKPSYLQFTYQEYAKNYLSIQKIINETLHTSVENTTGLLKPQINLSAWNMAQILISHNITKNIIFLFWKFVNCMNGIPQLLFFVILLFSFFYNIIRNKVRQMNLSSAFVIVITIITFLNAAMISICNPALPVYFCYSQFMCYCLAAFIVNNAFHPLINVDSNKI